MKSAGRILGILTLLLLLAWPTQAATTRIYPSRTTLPFLSITAGPLAPSTNDGAALGTITLGWSDLHIATGGVINWANGEVTITETNADTLTLAGGVLVFPVGSAGAPSSTFTGSTTTGLYSHAANNISIAVSGTLRYYYNGSLFGILNDSAGINLGASEDLTFRREAAAILQMGIDAATPIAQTFKGPDARAGTDTNTVGGRMNWEPGLSTGNAVPAIQSMRGGAATVTSGTGAQTKVDRFMPNAFKVLTNNSAIAVLNATIANGSSVGGLIVYTIEVWDGTDNQVETGMAVYSSKNKAGVVTGTITEVSSQQNLDSGTLATTWAISAANPAVITVNANSSLTPSTGYPRITFSIQNLGQQAIAIQ